MLPMDQPLKLSGDLEHDGTPDLDVVHALQLARSQRPELAAIDASIRQADAELSAARRRRLPTLSLVADRSEEHTSELQSLMRISYAVFCLKKKKQKQYEQNRYE